MSETIAVDSSRDLTAGDRDAVLDCAGPITLTVAPGLAPGYATIIMPNGTATIAGGAGVTINGAPSLQIDGSGSAMFALVKKARGTEQYALTTGVADPLAPVFAGPWAQRPSAASHPAGARLIATDIGAHGQAVFFSDGIYWRPQNGMLALSVLGADVAGIAAVGDQTLRTVTIPAGLWTPGGRIRLVFALDKVGVAGSMLMRAYVGSNLVANITLSASFVGGAVILQVKSLSDTSIQRTGANNLTSAIPLGTATGNARPAAASVPSLAANAIDLRVGTSKTAASADYAVLQEMTVEYMG